MSPAPESLPEAQAGSVSPTIPITGDATEAAVVPAGQEGVAALSPHAKLKPEDMRLVDVAGYAKRFERVAANRGMPWLPPAGYLLVGSGVGAWLAGKPMAGFVLVVTLVGLGALFGAWRWSRGHDDTLDSVCDDFRDYLERWKIISGSESLPPMSEEYEKLVFERRGKKRRVNRSWLGKLLDL